MTRIRSMDNPRLVVGDLAEGIYQATPCSVSQLREDANWGRHQGIQRQDPSSPGEMPEALQPA